MERRSFLKGLVGAAGAAALAPALGLSAVPSFHGVPLAYEPHLDAEPAPYSIPTTINEGYVAKPEALGDWEIPWKFTKDEVMWSEREIGINPGVVGSWQPQRESYEGAEW